MGAYHGGMLDYIFSFGIAEIASHLSMLVLGWLMIWIDRKLRRRWLRGDVEKAYTALQGACEPETLNPESPGNPDAMKATARNLVNLLRPRLKRASLYPPQPADKSEDSLRLWFQFLGSVRPDL